mgnify:CR=1 FL=1
MLSRLPCYRVDTLIIVLEGGITEEYWASLLSEEWRKREGMSLVYVVEDEKAVIKPVKLGDGVGNRFIVLGGIIVGDIVVIKGNERLRPGQKVAPLPINNSNKEEDK